MNYVDTSLLPKNLSKAVMGLHNLSGNPPLIWTVSATQFHAICDICQWPGWVYGMDFLTPPVIKVLYLEHSVQLRPRQIGPD